MNDDEVIDVGKPVRKRRWKLWIIAAIIAAFFLFSRVLGIYINALWFGSLGYQSVFWYMFWIKLELFLIFAALTIIILRGAFWLLERTFSVNAFERRTITVNNQPINFAPAKILRPVAWVVAVVIGLFFGLDMRGNWRRFALYLHQAQTSGVDPIFQKPVGFYFFSLPVYELISGWLIALAFITLVAALVYALLSYPQKIKTASVNTRRTGYAVVSVALAVFLLTLALRTYLSRFPYLWEDHQSFTGVTYTEAHYVLPGLLFVAIALIISALISVFNAFAQRRLFPLVIAIGLPLAVYVIAVFLIPAYVQSFIVKPNELGRETPYIEQNIAWTRRAFALDSIEPHEFDADTTTDSLDVTANKETFEAIRLWDWHALQDTLRQIQEIRTYYDFPDVDIDRYKIGGRKQQMMLAAREIDVEKLPEQSRNWVNERLIYTHGYGVTMNTSNGFDSEGMPLFVLSNMPIESSVPEIKVTRPEIYFGQKTDTDVYVKTKQKEFNYPQGEANNYTTYEGTGGVQIGNGLRRFMLAWGTDDLSKLPFSDDVTSESRLLMRRNIHERVESIAPFLFYDNDPYIVVADDGKLYWMIDAFTMSSSYPYSRHYAAGNYEANYIRNSVKVVIDAYNGATNFYVFDTQDPLVNTYRATFPALFKDAAEMPADLRAHVRYPETLLKTQGQVFGLYHTQNAKVFFQREDVWSVASQISAKTDKGPQAEPLEPYYVLMQLPGETAGNEFVQILPFTPSNRNNMIGWMAGRCDGDRYGSLQVYNFPKSRLIDGPLQVEARIDQNAQLSAQMTLWNQQGSHVLRGNLLVIPIGRGLLYVEPIYLKAERSPMPELRLVVLATQERLVYGTSFNEAITNLFGDSAKTLVAQDKTEPTKEKAANQTEQQQQQQPPPPAPTTSTPAANTQQLIKRASQEFDDYQRLTREGKFGEAGQKLDALKQTLEELKKTSGQQ